MTLTGRRLIVAMCLGQVANLLPHVALPALMALHLIYGFRTWIVAFRGCIIVLNKGGAIVGSVRACST